MTALNLALLGGVSNQAIPAAIPRVDRVGTALGVENRFAAAMDRAAHAAGVQVAAADPVAAKPAVEAQQTAQAVAPAADLERARRTLNLPAGGKDPVKPVGSGDAILDGLQKLRSTFDSQQGRLNAALSKPLTDAHAMIGLQVEVVNFSLLVDVTSKLTGKSTQAIETLMKGQ